MLPRKLNLDNFVKTSSINKHLIEIKENRRSWEEKPLLRIAYKVFYKKIIKCLHPTLQGITLELGSGIGEFKKFLPSCITSDIFNNPWVDQVESVYNLSFKDESCANIIMFDVLHHLEFPGTALHECHRVLQKEGRLVIFDQYISPFSFLVYGLFHHEPLGLFKMITWFKDGVQNPDEEYYAATSNVTKIFRFFSPFKKEISNEWHIIERRRFSAISYILSGGFSGPSLYSMPFLPFICFIEKVLDFFPILFATRTIIVLEKK